MASEVKSNPELNNYNDDYLLSGCESCSLKIVMKFMSSAPLARVKVRDQALLNTMSCKKLRSSVGDRQRFHVKDASSPFLNCCSIALLMPLVSLYCSPLLK